MCLINVAHKHFITQTGKKSKIALINFMEPGARGTEPGANIWGLGSRAKKNKYPFNYIFIKFIYITEVTVFNKSQQCVTII